MMFRSTGAMLALSLPLAGCASTAANPHVKRITSAAGEYFEQGRKWMGFGTGDEARSAEPGRAATNAAPAAEPPAAAAPAAPLPAELSLAPVEEVDLQAAAAVGIDFGNDRALIIGNNHYRHIGGLQSAAADALRLDRRLRKSYGFSTRLLLDASLDDILGALTDYRRNLGPQDNLLIYDAGHGWVDPEADEGYWLPVDAHPDDPVHWLSNATLTTSVRAMRAKHILVIADSCFAGKLTCGAHIGIRGADYLQRMASRRARTVLTSGGLEPVLDEGGDFLFVRRR